jgi:transcriptional regulator with XRE-family HTH domain
MTSNAWALCREIRRTRGWSQRRLAEEARTTPATIARIEKGRMEPSLELLERLARAAGLDIRMEVRPRDPDEAKARAQTRGLKPEQRLRRNDKLSRLHALRSR